MKTQGSMLPEYVPDQHFDYDDEFTSDDYETPDNVAQKIASLVLPSDLDILEPAAGTGQIVKAIPAKIDRKILAVEIKKNRFNIGSSACASAIWAKTNFLELDFSIAVFDLVVTNPPFSLGIEFIEQSLKLLNLNYKHARLLFLLPHDFFHSTKRNAEFSRLDCHIHQVYGLINRVAYIKDGKALSGRQVYDSVFDLRPGRKKGGLTFL
jgi:adenine-specific DNA methylase